jgi:flavin reductase (DIM6/NTAB) family NADH-FMN oxidoreductase RutF
MITVHDFHRAMALLRNASDPIVITSGDTSCEVPASGILKVSACPPTVAIAVAVDAPLAWEAMASRTISLTAREGAIETKVVRWLPGGDTHTLFLIEVVSVPAISVRRSPAMTV